MKTSYYLSFLIFVLFIGSGCLFTRNKVSSKYWRGNIEMPPSLIFEHYEPVRYPNFYGGERLAYYGQTILLSALVYIDSVGKVKSMNISPLVGIGNDLAATDSIWSALEDSIRSASLKWKFKPLLDEKGKPETIGRLRDIELYQRHLILFRFGNSVELSYFIHKQYMLRN